MDRNAPTVAELLVQNIPRDLILAVDEALEAGARRAYMAAAGMHQGHLPNVLGQMRHFHMNEAYADALAASGIVATPLKGNSVVVGTSGIVRLGRFNLSHGVWNNAKRSKSRVVMAQANTAIQAIVLGDLFDEKRQVAAISAFFVSLFSGSLKVQPEWPLSVEIAVPDTNMEGWLFREPLSHFLQRYESGAPQQPDLATPKLREKVATESSDQGLA